ncbi:MAG TPA: AtpZ/AtpI family protein [Phycisphaerales bacterium]|nr:AtpZ/AtpI family protein [Phycisphaerales bacterium]
MARQPGEPPELPEELRPRPRPTRPGEPRPKRVVSALGPIAAVGTVGTEFVAAVGLLALGGWWLDGKFGTAPVLTLVGMVLGLTVGTWRLLRAVKELNKPPKKAAGGRDRPGP